MSPIAQGLVLLVVGMTILFAAMAVLILAMVILERLFRTRRLMPDKQEPAESEAVSQLARGTQDEEIVAAIAVALAQLRASDIGRSGLGAALEAGRGAWWARGSAHPRPEGRKQA